MPKVLIHKILYTLAFYLCFSPVLYSCSITYSDGSWDTANLLSAWSVIEDDWVDTANGCGPSLWGSFVHTYESRVTISSPSCRIQTGYSFGSASGGTSLGWNRAEVAIDFNGEFGNYVITDY